MKQLFIAGIIVLSMVNQSMNFASHSSPIPPQHINSSQEEESTTDLEYKYKGELTLVHSYLKTDIQLIELFYNKSLKYGFIDTKSGLVIEPQYDEISQYTHISLNNSLVPVRLNNKWGYINSQNDTIIELKYDGAQPYSDELAIVEINNQFGIINTKDKLILPIGYDEIYRCDDGIFILKSNNKYGLYNNNLEIIIEPKYIDPIYFKNDIALVSIDNDSKQIIDTSGKVLKKITGEAYINGEQDPTNYNRFIGPLYIVYMKDNKFGAYKYDNNLLTEFAKPIYTNLIYRNNNMYFDKFTDNSQNKMSYGYLNSSGVEQKLYNRSDELTYGQLYNGLKTYINENGMGYMDKDNNIIIEAQYQYAQNFYKNGYAIVQTKNQETAIIDTKGRLIFKTKESSIVPVNEYNSFISQDTLSDQNIKYATIESNDGRSVLFDVENAKTISDDYRSYILADNSFIVNNEAQSGLMKLDGTILVKPSRFFDYEEYLKGYQKKSQNNKFYLTDLNGKRLHNNSYDHISPINDYDYRLATVNSKVAITNKNGVIVSSEFYNEIIFIDQTHFFAITVENKISTIKIVQLEE